MIKRVQYQIQKNFNGPPILTDKVRSAIKHMKHDKAPVPDDINIEMIAAMEDMAVETITKLLNDILDTTRDHEIWKSMITYASQHGT